MCLADFLLGLILLPVPARLSLPSSCFLLTMVNPKKKAPKQGWTLRKCLSLALAEKRTGYLGRVTLGASWKLLSFPKLSSYISPNLFYLLIIFILNVKHTTIFYGIILDSKSVRIIFVRYREPLRSFKNWLLIHLVWAAYEPHTCVHPAPECSCTLQLITFGSHKPCVSCPKILEGFLVRGWPHHLPLSSLVAVLLYGYNS